MVARFLSLTALAAFALAMPASAGNPCATTTHTTLDGTSRDGDGDGRLECLPGEAYTVRQDLAPAADGRSPTLLTAFMTLADFQLADEESPLRGEWADKCGSLPTASAFRPQETMVPHLLNAHVRAATSIAQAGSPALDGAFDFVVSLGDLADNQQYNETRLFIDILDGGTVDTDSGADGYDGVQGNEPEGADGTLSVASTGFPTGGSILDLANEPFLANGLRYPDGSGGTVRLPWYSVIGNHDMKVQGTITDLPGWREFVRAWVLGNVKVTDIGPDYQQELCANPELFGNPAFWMKVLSNPQSTKIVPADPDRKLVDKADWMAEHDVTTGVPTGHGFNENPAETDPAASAPRRCRDANGNLLERACYSFTQGSFHYVALDTTAAEGLETGNVDEAQWQWLQRELAAHSSSFFDGAGSPVSNPDGVDKLIVVFSHHTITSTSNIGVPLVDRDPFAETPVGQQIAALQGFHTGQELQALLLRFPNVILQANGHTHQNKIWARSDPTLGTGYWEVNTSAIVDYPQQSRTIEIADNGDCTLSVFATIFDAWVAPDARDIDWTADDPTPADGINEDWMAAAAREVALNDPQKTDSAGALLDRNAELLIDAPGWFCSP